MPTHLEPLQPRWEIATAYADSAELDELLHTGWEPFAVTDSRFGNGNHVVWLRRQSHMV